MADAPEFLPPDENEEQIEQESDEVTPSALAILNRSEHAAMVQTANIPRNRRKLVEFESKLMAYANHSQPIAISMFYSLGRAGKQIIGPSVRFAEIVAPCWRNCAVGSRAIGDGDKTVTAQGIFIDYEANLRNSVEVPRRVTDKDGKRFSDDMIVVTMNAAMSVARRNSVLKGGVPQALWTPSYEAAQLTAVGKAASHAQRVADAMDYLHKLGVTEWQILNAVGVSSPKELETEHLVILRVLCTEIKKGEKTIEQVFGSPFDKEMEVLFAQLKLNQAQQTMLKNSYLGRAAELVAYLRDRVGAGTKGATTEAPRRTQATQEKADQPDKTADATRTVVYSDGTTATGVGPLPDQSPAQQDQTEPTGPDDKRENLTIPDDSPRTTSPADTAPWGRDTPKATGFDYGANEQKGQTTMDPGQRRRGRPTREEAARKAAGVQGTSAPSPTLTDDQQDDFRF